MRLFVAIVPPSEVLEDLAEHVGPRREAGPDLRWADASQWHVTLAFMPAVRPDRIEDLGERLATAAIRTEPFALGLAGAGCFPDVTRARVLWCGVADPSAALPALARGIRNACAVAGGSPEGGPFSPHTTLARLPRPVDATRWVRVLAPYAGPLWTADHVTLMASHLGQGRGRRPRYEEVDRFPIGGQATAAAHRPFG